MRLEDALNIMDLQKLARRRLPKILFDLLDSGVEDEYGLTRNIQAFSAFRLMPRYLGDITQRDLSTELFGKRYDMPFGIAPTGFAALFRPAAELDLVGAAKAANIPVIVSGACVEPIEKLAAAHPDLWCHLYPARDESVTARIVERQQDAGISTLVVTVDNPVYPKRERDTRNGFRMPMRLTPRMIASAIAHPAWTLNYLRTGGVPVMNTWARFLPEGASGAEVTNFFRSQSPSIQTWKSMEELRQRWKGRLILKGVQHPDDAVRAAETGFDAVIVSNHGGKAFDRLPSPLETLPGVKAAVEGRIPVLFDSGIRRGADMVIAKCLGADFVFVGRATLYGVVAGGRSGVDRALAILREELDMTLAMIGCNRFADLSAESLLGPETALPRQQPVHGHRHSLGLPG